MSVKVVSTSSEYVSYADTPSISPAAGDFTLFMWLYINAMTDGSRLFCKGNSSGGTGGGKRYECYVVNSADFAFAIDDNVTKIDTNNTPTGNWTGPSTSTWYPAIFECDAGTHIKIFTGSTEVGTKSGGSGDIDAPLSLLIGASRAGDDTPVSFGNFTFGEIAFWKRLLSTGEKAALGDGFSPILLNPTFYSPNVNTSNYNDRFGITGSPSGSPDTFAHPRVIYPRRRQIFVPAAAAPAAGGGFLTLLGVG